MAEPLFDISGHDLSRTHVSPELLDELLPQCGDMRQLDRVVWIDEASKHAIGIKKVRDDEFWVPGHIPGRPLLPGVIMIEAAAQLSSVLYQYRLNFENAGFLGFTRVDDCVFRGSAVPGDTMVLLAVEKKFQRRRFACYAQGLIDGNVIFEVRCTGMRI
ncbi:MAG: hypothetical protein QF561_02955 [Phycisphaerales bacterium]|jgi:3-hydroxyacyl-[acyl-carrier-protein] dehydratase|nr:hypothetical protein [Phycisphaerales bacterium]